MAEKKAVEETKQKVVDCHSQEKKVGNNSVHSVVPESSAQGTARNGMGGGKMPYCYRCLVKGHTMHECTTEVVCEICESFEHVKARCPLYRSVNKLYAKPCGYGVQGLGFFYIPHAAKIKAKTDGKAALIRVTEGSLNVDQVTAEMERLIPGKWKWVVQAVGENLFNTTFPSTAELQRMVEWGMVQSKNKTATMVIEERTSVDGVKMTLPKIWVQCRGLPDELREFVVIWAVGIILGVTKDVDMVFTRVHGISRLQVMVLDPDLIPNAIDVVIGDNMYELQFHVEPAGSSSPAPMEMDGAGGDLGPIDPKENRDDNNDEHEKQDGKKKGTAQEKGNREYSGGNGSSGNKMVYHFTIPGMMDSSQNFESDDMVQEEAEAETDEDEDDFEMKMNSIINVGSVSDEMLLQEVTLGAAGSVQMRAEALAAIPDSSPSRKSKRRSNTVDQHSLERAEKLKAARNLESNLNPGTIQGNSLAPLLESTGKA